MPMPAPLLSSFAPSLSGGFALFGRRDSDVVIPTYTNAQKLSLASNTAVGTRVKVSDGFVVSGVGDENGFYAFSGTQSGFPVYTRYPIQDSGGGGPTRIFFDPAFGDPDGAWRLFSGLQASTIFTSSADNPPDPWSGTWDSPIVLTHPAVQQLASPSSAQGGVFVSGGTQDGIYTVTGTHLGKPVYALLGGGGVNPGDSFVAYWTNNINAEYGVGPSSAGWGFGDAGPSLVYYSLSNVATPDLASNWKNAGDDSPASITVTLVTGGQVAAGMKFGSDFYAVTTPVNGRNAYHDVLGVAPDFTFNGTIWTDGTHNGTGAPAFPWSVTGITITQDNVASETNWTNV